MATFVFVSVILMVKGLGGTAPTADGAAGAMAVVATLYGVIYVSLHNGACMNPAVALGLSALRWQAGEAGSDPNRVYAHYLYAYMLGPAVGGVMAGAFGLLHKKVHDNVPEVDDEGYQRVN